jgi:hypothetical protein
METFKKRQKEMQRLEKQRDKAAKRKEIKARKAAGIVAPEDENEETTALASPSLTDTVVPLTN